MAYDPAGIPPEEEVLWTAEELAALSARDMLECQVEPEAEQLWVPGKGAGKARRIVAYRPGVERGMRLPRVSYRAVAADGTAGGVQETYLSCFYAWSRINHARPAAPEVQP